jgi:hypothetical protein
MRRRLTGLCILLLALGLAPSAALASGCDHDILVQIAFARGATQWVHRGAGTTYVGYFKKGQSLTIAGAGGTNYAATSDLSWARSSQDPWQFTLLGPGGFGQTSDLDGAPLVVGPLPATGKYTLSLTPCAAWGESGTVMILTTPE